MEIKIVESLDYGMNLLSDGRVVKKDGTIITKEEYAMLQELSQRNKLDWHEIPQDEFFNLLEKAQFATKTYETVDEISGMTQSKMGFACLDEEGEPFYLRSSEFSGNEKFEFTECSYSQLIYNVDRNSSEEAFEVLDDKLQTIFDVKEQVGNEFCPDEDTTYKTKKFIRNHHVFSIVWKNGKLSNVKQGEKLSVGLEVTPKTSKVADAITNDRFANLV